MTAYVVPVVAGIGGILFLSETFTPMMLVGMGLIISGIVIINQRVAVPVNHQTSRG
jgi:drug/metabolite transporter (DMT)-like permease